MTMMKKVNSHLNEFDEEDDSIVYEIQMDDEELEEEIDSEYLDMEEDDSEYLDMEEDDSEYLDMEQVEDPVMESKKMSANRKGIGFGSPSKFKYDKSPNLGTGFKTKMKEAPKSVGTGKAKFDYKDGENAGSKLGNNKMVKK